MNVPAVVSLALLNPLCCLSVESYVNRTQHKRFITRMIHTNRIGYQILRLAFIDSQTQNMTVREGRAYGAQWFFLAVLYDGHLAREVDDAGRGVVEDEFLRAVPVPMNLA